MPTHTRFDLVYSRLMLRHTADSAAAVEWMWGAVAQGGQLVLADADDTTLLFHPHQSAINSTIRRAGRLLTNRYGNPHAATSGRTLPELLARCGATDTKDAALTLTTSGNLFMLPSLAEPMLLTGCAQETPKGAPVLDADHKPVLVPSRERRLNKALDRWRASPGAFASWTLFYAVGTRR